MKEWHIYTDGASLNNPGPSGAGMVALDAEGNEVWRDSIYLGEMTNNMAEYEALVRALERVKDSAVSYTDSLLVANQILGKYRIKNERLRPYLDKARELIAHFIRFDIRYVPREKNKVADGLAKNAATRKG